MSPTYSMEKKWFVYILECIDGSYYTGITNDINARMETHAIGKGSKYVYRKGFKQLLKIQQCEDKSEACKCEYKIKQLPKNKKLAWFDK
jgi:putative endonuclease